MSGRPISSRMASKFCCLVMSSACPPEPASTTANSSWSCSCSASECRNAMSSSTIRILRPPAIFPPPPVRRMPLVLRYRGDAVAAVPASALDTDAMPEGNMVLDVRCRRLRRRIVPCRIGIYGLVHDHGVVMRRALPGTHRRRGAGREEALIERFGREVDIALDHLEA